jgi:hypothetical protein
MLWECAKQFPTQGRLEVARGTERATANTRLSNRWREQDKCDNHKTKGEPPASSPVDAVCLGNRSNFYRGHVGSVKRISVLLKGSDDRLRRGFEGTGNGRISGEESLPVSRGWGTQGSLVGD